MLNVSKLSFQIKMQKIVSKQGNEVAFKFTNTEKLNIKQYEK